MYLFTFQSYYSHLIAYSKMNFTKNELIDLSHALLCYRTDSTIIDPKGNGLTDEQKAKYIRLSDLMEKVSQVRASI